jgi:hypothetical protein
VVTGRIPCFQSYGAGESGKVSTGDALTWGTWQ